MESRLCRRKGSTADARRVMFRGLLGGLLSVSVLCTAGAAATAASPPRIHAFGPGEQLFYRISWSRIFTAGVAVMEVKRDILPDGEEVLVFTAKARSVGLVDKLYGLEETAESVFDPRTMESRSFSFVERHGRKTRRRSLVFDHERRVVTSRVNKDPPKTEPVPDGVQDALTWLYVLRTKADFTGGAPPVSLEVHQSGKNWSVRFQILGREKVKTEAGVFHTIKIVTHPRFKGIFMNKGEIFIWLTDDEWKIPVLIKSRIAIGSVVLSLTGIKRPGSEQ